MSKSREENEEGGEKIEGCGEMVESNRRGERVWRGKKRWSEGVT